MGLVSVFLGAALAGAVAGLVMGRFARPGGCLCVIVGAAPMVLLFAYETWFYTKGDTSSWGLLSTILILLALPFGLSMLLVGWLRGG